MPVSVSDFSKGLFHFGLPAWLAMATPFQTPLAQSLPSGNPSADSLSAQTVVLKESRHCPDGWEGRPIASLAWRGLRTTSPALASRQLRHQPKGHFHCRQWLAERNRLADLDVFSDIQLTLLSQSENHDSLVMTYQVRELPPYIPYIAMSKTDQDGFSAGPAVAALNLFGTGAHLEAAARFGGTTEAYASIAGSEVAAFPLEYDLLMAHVDSWNTYQLFHENSWRFKLDTKVPVAGEDDPWLAVTSVEYFTMQSDRVGITSTGQTDHLPRLALGWAYDGRNRRHLPDSGLYVEALVRQTGGPLGGSVSNREYLLDGRWYWPFARKHGLAVNGLYRFREGNVPPYDAFRAGGANSLRGFEKGTRIGRSEALFSIEERWSVVEHRSFQVWRWGIPISLQAIAGIEFLRSWNHDALAEADGPVALYVGLHLLTAGLDRLRFEGGSGLSRFAPNADIGFFDKADAQRFRTR
jgi:Omp85 superfamily domain